MTLCVQHNPNLTCNLLYRRAKRQIEEDRRAWKHLVEDTDYAEAHKEALEAAADGDVCMSNVLHES